MRIVLDLTDAPCDHIEGTANWADNGQPVAFSGWLALLRLIENAQRRDDDATAPTPVDSPQAAKRSQPRLEVRIAA